MPVRSDRSAVGTVRRALLSVYDKSGIVEFARGLAGLGVELISTGGTAQTLRQAGLSVRLVEDLTGVAAMLDGRVKTLHPVIHAAILADRANPQHMDQLRAAGIEPIDLVAVDLYPFEKAAAQHGGSRAAVIEMIDIGGPCMLRAAAKNHDHVLPVCDAADYAVVLAGLTPGGPALDAAAYARKAFARVSAYDARIAAYLAGEAGAEQAMLDPLRWAGRAGAQTGLPLRYGENPQQSARWYAWDGGLEARLRPADGGELSFNNLADAHAALEACKELARAWPQRAAFVYIKHGNPCGAGLDDDPIEAYRKAYLGDPLAAMGGVLAGSRPVDGPLAEAVMGSLDRWGRSAGAGAFFVEVWLAPRFDPQAVGLIRSLRPWGNRVRLISFGDPAAPPDPGEPEVRSITGGLLVQTRDLLGLDETAWRVVTRRGPSDSEMHDLRLAWLLCKHTRSNAISLCRDGMLLGNGAGQMSRVMSCRLALWAASSGGLQGRVDGAVAASDAFFPFSDGPRLLLDGGITALIQPGGSKRDAETIELCDERGAAMVLTGARHFKH